MKMNKLTLIALAIGFVFTACTSDDTPQTVAPRGDYENGILISHEGNFGQGNASVSYVSNDLTTVENGIFNNVNNELLGDTAQSITFLGNLAYIVINGSQKIEVVDRFTFQSVGTISTGLVNPRYMTIVNNQGYVTDWGDGSSATDDVVAIINLSTNSVSGTISVAEGPEQILASGNSIYVSHKGGWGVNNIISRINAITETVTTIPVNDVPDDMALDNSGNLVVLCQGADLFWLTPPVETPASIVKINTVNSTISSTLEFPDGIHPELMTYGGGKTYFHHSDKIFALNDSDTTLPTTSIIDTPLYGFSVNSNTLYGVKTDFVAGTGELIVYDLSSNTLTDTKTLSVGAAKVYFN